MWPLTDQSSCLQSSFNSKGLDDVSIWSLRCVLFSMMATLNSETEEVDLVLELEFQGTGS